MSVVLANGIIASAVGAPRAQASGSDVERAGHDAADVERAADSHRQATGASGIAETDGRGLQAFDRDADGRQAWQIYWAERASGSDMGDGGRKSVPAERHLGAALDFTA